MSEFTPGVPSLRLTPSPGRFRAYRGRISSRVHRTAIDHYGGAFDLGFNKANPEALLLDLRLETQNLIDRFRTLQTSRHTCTNMQIEPGILHPNPSVFSTNCTPFPPKSYLHPSCSSRAAVVEVNRFTQEPRQLCSSHVGWKSEACSHKIPVQYIQGPETLE